MLMRGRGELVAGNVRREKTLAGPSKPQREDGTGAQAGRFVGHRVGSDARAQQIVDQLSDLILGSKRG